MKLLPRALATLACAGCFTRPDARMGTPNVLSGARLVARTTPATRPVRPSHWRFGETVIRTEAHTLSASDARSGALRWSHNIDAVHVVRAGSRLGVIAVDQVLVLDVDTGETLWSLPLDNELRLVRIALYAGTLYRVAWGTAITIAAFEIESGKPLWKAAPIPSELWVDAVAVGQTHVFVCAASSMLIGWGKHDGRRALALGVPGCEDFAVHPGPTEELSLSESSTAPLLFFQPLPLPDPRVVLEGTVTDVENRPVGAVRVDAGLGTTRTDGRGRYRVVPAIAGEVCVLAHAEGIESALTCVRPEAGETRRLDLRVGTLVPGGPRYAKRRLP